MYFVNFEYNSKFRDIPISLPKSFQNRNSSFYRYVVCMKDMRDELVQHLNSANIEAIKCSSEAVHTLIQGLNDKDYPNASNFYSNSISIPIYPSLKSNESHHIARTVRDFFLK